MEQETVNAIRQCFATRGKNRGKLLSRCPPMGTPQAAAWQALALAWNPYKASVTGLIFMPEANRFIYREALAWAESNAQLRGLDRDRAILESLGAW